MSNDKLKKLTIKESGLFYMQYRVNRYWHESKNAWHCSLYGENNPIHEVMVTEDLTNTSQYYAWFNNEKKDFEYIWGSELQTKMCFPYGTKVEEELGRGRLTRVNIEFIKVIKE